jgi:peptidoglycan/xylan/chitin deacetylase (PgdA/CDA1 family)
MIITGAADGVFGPQYLTWEEIRRLARYPGLDFQSHTLTHPWDSEENLLTWLEPGRREKGLARVMLELKSSKSALEARLRRPVWVLAWPKGWYNQELIQLARDAGYTMLLTIREKSNVRTGSILEVNRYFVHGNWDLPTFAKLVEQAN